jgi:hypothetical protein
MYLIANLDEHPAPHGYSIGITGYTAKDGREYAIFGCYNGTAFVDITNSSNVHEIDYLPGMDSDWRDIKIWRHYAYIVGYVPGCAMQIANHSISPTQYTMLNVFISVSRCPYTCTVRALSLCKRS